MKICKVNFQTDLIRKLFLFRKLCSYYAYFSCICLQKPMYKYKCNKVLYFKANINLRHNVFKFKFKQNR